MNAKCIKSKLTAAFSLIELMVVIAIVALLTAIAVPSYQSYLQQSKVTEIFSLASDQMNQWEQQYNLGAASFDVIGTTALGSYITSAELTSGAATMTNCTAVLTSLGGGLGGVCIQLNATAGNIDASLANVVMAFGAIPQTNVSGDTTDTGITWLCGFSNTTSTTPATATTLLSPGPCTGY